MICWSRLLDIVFKFLTLKPYFTLEHTCEARISSPIEFVESIHQSFDGNSLLIRLNGTSLTKTPIQINYGLMNIGCVLPTSFSYACTQCYYEKIKAPI